MKKHRDKTWDKWYRKGVNWDNNKPSQNIIRFRKRLNKKWRVLDLGCGSGRDIIYLAKEGFDSYGVDFSKVAIKKAKKGYKGKNLHLFVNRTENLPFEDGFFDAIYCGYVLYYTNMEKSISEIERVIKKKGLFYLVLGLRTKYLKTEKIKTFMKEREILHLVKKFRIVKKINSKTESLSVKNPHRSDVIRLILEKR